MNIFEIAENMAAAIREWNRAKQERESWTPIPGQVPPVGILGSAKKANTMLTQALEEYESFRRSEQLDGVGELVRVVGEILKERGSLTVAAADVLRGREKIPSRLLDELTTALDGVWRGSASEPLKPEK